MLYLYAIVDGLASVDDLTGAAQEPLRLLVCDSVTVVYGELTGRPQVDERTLNTQDRVVRALHSRAAALLPMRFGASFTDASDVARAIRNSAVGLGERLEVVRGCDQMTLRILRASDRMQEPKMDASAATGTDYLQNRARPRSIAPLLDAVASTVRATRIERGRAAGVVATVYHLIDRGVDVEYRRRLDVARPLVSGLALRVTGPSPCYAFASAI